DADVRVVILTGAGEKAFSAGADINVFAQLTPMEARTHIELARKITAFIAGMGKPVIAAVNGYAFGGGCELSLACDLVVASENAKFALPEINIGLIPGGGGTQRLPRLVGARKAKELIFTGEPITAQQALELGLVNKVVPADKLMETVRELAGKLAAKSPAILKLAKAAVNHSMESTLTAGLGYEGELFSLCFSTEDQKEGVKAFLEKRKPAFKGR
ncbi:MAG: enoyl-CoA hydratase/isomerase family protein, partial [Candidatus Bathyarchaeia archaeon]